MGGNALAGKQRVRAARLVKNEMEQGRLAMGFAKLTGSGKSAPRNPRTTVDDGSSRPAPPPSAASAPRRKPLSSRHPSPSTSSSPVEILSQIRTTTSLDFPLPQTGSPSSSHAQHNHAILNLLEGIKGRLRNFSLAFNQGWLPIRAAGGAARPKPSDLAHVLEAACMELQKGALSRAQWKDVKELVLWLAGELDMPGVARWAWKELESGVEGAERVVDAWEAITRGEHLALRKGPNALNRAYQRRYLGTPPQPLTKAPAAIFGAYIAARSMLHTLSSSPTPTTFASILPSLLSPTFPALKRFHSQSDFSTVLSTPLLKAAVPSPETSLALAHSWIRQVSLAQLWFHEREDIPGFEIVRMARTNFRTSAHRAAWETWKVIKEGVESKDVKWIDESRWDASGQERWLGSKGRTEEEQEVELRRGAAIELVKGEKVNSDFESETVEALDASSAPVSDKSSTLAPSTTSTNDTFLPTAYLTQALLVPFIAGFTRAHLLDQANDIWTWLPSHSPSLIPGVVTWTALLHGYGSRGDVVATESVFTAMVTAGVRPDVWAWMERVSAQFEAKDPDKAMELADTMSKDEDVRSQLENGRFPPVVYGRLILGLLSNGRVEQAEEVLAHMEEDGVPTTIHTINNFLHHYTRGSKPNLQAVVRCLRLVSDKGLEADVFTFTMVLQSLLSTGQRDATAKLVQIMEATKIRPSVTTYGAIINHLASSGKPDQLAAAAELIDEMERKKLETNEVIYTSLIQGFLHAIGHTPVSTLDNHEQHPYFTAALTLKTRMERRGIAMNRIGYNAIIASALSLQTSWGIELALRTFREMQSRPGMFGKSGDGTHEIGKDGKSVTPSDTWYVLLDGFAKMGDWSRARALVQEMEQSGFDVRSKAMRKLVDRVQRGGWAVS